MSIMPPEGVRHIGWRLIHKECVEEEFSEVHLQKDCIAPVQHWGIPLPYRTEVERSAVDWLAVNIGGSGVSSREAIARVNSIPGIL
jgi:hypothetical protein